LIGLWIVLFVTVAAVTVLMSVFVFRHIDLRYEMFAGLLIVPGVQALVLHLAARRPDAVAIREAAVSAWRHPLVRPVIVLDCLLLGLGWLAWRHPSLGLAGSISVQPAWMGTKAVAASAFFVPVLVRRAPWWERGVLGTFAAGLCGIGLAAFWPWLQALPEVLFPAATSRLTVGLRLLLAYGGLFVTAVVLLLGTAPVLRRRWPPLALCCDAALALVLLVGVIVVVHFYLRPWVEEPWRSVAMTSGSLASTLLLVCGILAASAQTGRERSPVDEQKIRRSKGRSQGRSRGR
jgi:hypothetical protein